MRDENGRFIKGHATSNRGKTVFKKGHTPWGKGIKATQDTRMQRFVEAGHKTTSKVDPLWHGDGNNYLAVHRWVESQLGRPGYCEECKTSSASRFHWHNINRMYKKRLEDWRYLCPKCHAQAHKELAHA